MAYRIEGKDIVISGFENGISDSVYSGAADMRNIELLTVPGEASVALGTDRIFIPPAMTGVAFTATASDDTITVADTTGLYNGAAITLVTNTAGGLSTGIVYYIHNLTATTFTLSVAPAASTVNISSDGTGTFDTYTYAPFSPVSYYADDQGLLAGVNAIFVVDSEAHVWFFLSDNLVDLTKNHLYFAGNIGGIAASGSTGITGINVWNGYLFLLGPTAEGTDIVNGADLLFTAPWIYTWQHLNTINNNGVISTLVSQDFNNLYWISDLGIDSLTLNVNAMTGAYYTFDPTDSATYTINRAAVTISGTDFATTMAQLGQQILIGGRSTFVYVWNQIDPSFSSLLNIPDAYTTRIVATSQNAYVFAGVRGKIYITNGSGIDLFKKVPDYLTGVLNPLYSWQDASFGRNQLYFSFIVRAATGFADVVDTVSGAWCIDLDTNSLRMLNKTSGTEYQGTPTMVTQRPSNNSSSPIIGVVGNNLAIGWYDSTGSQIDYSTGDPYSDYEAFIETEIIPVGTFLDQFTPSQIEWKTSAPIVAGEGIKLSFRENIADSWTLIGESLGSSIPAGSISDLFKANFQKVQWAQFKIETKSIATGGSPAPSNVRLTEIRIRDWPSGKNMSSR